MSINSSAISEDLSMISSNTSFAESSNLSIFTYAKLRLATRNFRPDFIIAEGSCGTVYKGQLQETMNTSGSDNGMVVAIKRFNRESSEWMYEHKWQERLNLLGRISHPNLLKLIGYCLDESMFLVYEFMVKGSLESHLFRRGADLLSWSLRVKILIGAARGLAFLHSLETPFIHRNFKASKVLLDSNYNAKLSDLRLARDTPDVDLDISHVSTEVMGTYGYAAPEYVATGHLYVKSDVYSFGVVLLEVLAGRRVIDSCNPTGELYLVDWARPYLADRRRLRRVMDPRLGGQYSSKIALQASQLALRCLSNDHKTRPSMVEVLKVLEDIDSKDLKMKEPMHSSLQVQPSGAVTATARMGSRR